MFCLHYPINKTVSLVSDATTPTKTSHALRLTDFNKPIAYLLISDPGITNSTHLRIDVVTPMLKIIF